LTGWIRKVGTLEAIKVKILIMGDEQVKSICNLQTISLLLQLELIPSWQNPLTLRIELTSENDLFFQ
jgi:hypothetical protein